MWSFNNDSQNLKDIHLSNWPEVQPGFPQTFQQGKVLQFQTLSSFFSASPGTPKILHPTKKKQGWSKFSVRKYIYLSVFKRIQKDGLPKKKAATLWEDLHCGLTFEAAFLWSTDSTLIHQQIPLNQVSLTFCSLFLLIFLLWLVIEGYWWISIVDEEEQIKEGETQSRLLMF